MLRSKRGFTLIEVLITMVVVGSAIALYTATLGVFPVTRATEHKAIALRIAEHKLADLRAAKYAALPASGAFTDSQFTLLPESATGTVAVSTVNAKTKQVSVTVEWREPGKATSTVTLSTLITEVGGL